MNRMQKHNLYNIKRNFEKKTGTRLISAGSKEEKAFAETAAPRKRLPRVALIAAIITVFVTLTAFAVSIFSTWASDSLTITASYYGSGIVWVEITNQSDKDLKLEPKINLYYYSTRDLVESTGEDPYIENLTIPANSTEKVRLDLRRTYDIEALENSKNEFYYLQMTNDSFLLGQKWSCQVSFVVSDYVTPWYELSDESCLEGVLPSLKPYFKNFTWDVFARWPDALDYAELVQEELAKVDGRIVRSCGTPIYFEKKDWLISSNNSTFDAYNKLLGIDDTEYYYQIGVQIPCPSDSGQDNGGWIMPIFYLYQYASADIENPQDYAFIRGNLLTFEELEPYKVYDDGEYVVYEMHHLFYSDLKTYVNDMMLQRDDMYMDEHIWKRIETIYEHWSNKTNMNSYFYRLGEGTTKRTLSMDEVIRMSQKGEAISYEDISPYTHGVGGFTIIESDTGRRITIDAYYELFYGLNIDGTLRGWYLIHKPTGDTIDIRYEDVKAFVEAHDDPLPRCSCENLTKQDKAHHGWTITMEWLLAQGNDIVDGDLGFACAYHETSEDRTSWTDTYPILGTADYYVENREGTNASLPGLWLVHTETGDRCDLETEDATAFVNAHGGVE